MTRVYADEEAMELSVSGHAGFGPRGADIVCAGISALTCTLLERLEDKGLLVDYAQDTQKGLVWLQAVPCPTSKAYMDFCLAGLCLLAESYPENICVEIQGAA